MDSIRTVLIGMGAGAERLLLPALTSHPDLQLVAACDVDARQRREVAGRWEIRKVYADAAMMLEAEQPELVAIATPPETHRDLALLSLDHGCHLYCEKPLTTSLPAADEVFALAQNKQRLVAVNNQYYQMPIFRQIQAEIDSGRSGRVYHVHAWQQMFLPPHEEVGWKRALRPRRVLMEFGTHAIDLVCRFFRAYPRTVSAQIARPLPQDGTDICISARLDFPDHRLATLSFNRMSRAPLRYFEMRVDGVNCSMRASLGGLARLELGWSSERSRPRVRFSMTKGGEARFERDGRSRLLARQAGAAIGEATTAHLANFVSAIRDGRQSETSDSHIRAVLATMLACYESAARQGATIEIS